MIIFLIYLKQMNSVPTNTLFPNHKLVYEFNKKPSQAQPDLIFLAERHRINYNPENDRQLNLLAVEALNLAKGISTIEDNVLIVEAPSDEEIDSDLHIQTKNLSSRKLVYGCMDPKAFKKTKEANDFIIECANLITKSESASVIQKNDWLDFLKKDWKDEWPKEQFFFPTETEEGFLKQDIINFFREFWAFKTEIINSSYIKHTQAMIKRLETHTNASQIFIFIGKNHLYIPKKLRTLYSLLDKPDEMEESIKLFHDYLNKNGKWCVICKPKKTLDHLV